MHKRGSSTIDLVFTKGISNLKCQTKEFDLINIPNVRNSTTLINSLMNITIFLKFIFIIDAFREYNSHLQDITS